MSNVTISIKDPQMEYAYHFASVIDPIYEEDYLFDKDGKVVVDKKGNASLIFRAKEVAAEQ